jgi:hypothetical protein
VQTNNCGCEKTSLSASEMEKLQNIQSQFDRILAGKSALSTSTEKADEVFTVFLPDHAHRAAALAALCKKRAKTVGGVDGLEGALTVLYQFEEASPRGMIEHAAKLFLTHYGPAREHILLRSLEERQPSMTTPSEAVVVVSKAANQLHVSKNRPAHVKHKKNKVKS